MAPMLLLSTVALASVVMFASAQSSMSAQSSASIFIVNADPQPLVGSIVGMQGATTTYRIQCSDPEECGFIEPFTYVKDGTSSIEYAIGKDGFTATISCSVQGTVSAVCTAAGDIPPEPSGAPAEAEDVTITLSANEVTYTQIPITGNIAAAVVAPSTGGSASSTPATPSTEESSMTARSTASQSGTTSSQSSSSSGQANTTGNTAGATTLGRSSMIALVGAAAVAAVLM